LWRSCLVARVCERDEQPVADDPDWDCRIAPPDLDRNRSRGTAVDAAPVDVDVRDLELLWERACELGTTPSRMAQRQQHTVAALQRVV
jgi:hypothetical protein